MASISKSLLKTRRTIYRAYSFKLAPEQLSSSFLYSSATAVPELQPPLPHPTPSFRTHGSSIVLHFFLFLLAYCVLKEKYAVLSALMEKQKVTYFVLGIL